MDAKAFFDAVKLRYGKLSIGQVAGFNAVLGACEGAPISHAAYMLATAWHETNKTMQPVREAYWCSEGWRAKNLRYSPYYGRGYVQLTWAKNYQRADDELGLNGTLMADLDVAMEPAVAAAIMRKGMDEGWFTARSMRKLLPDTGRGSTKQYVEARTIINGHDRAGDVAAYADVFDDALILGGWA